MSALLLIGPIGIQEMLIILFVGLLIFGARLPEVGRSLGKGLMEFKRGLRGMQDQFEDLDRESDAAIDSEIERKAVGSSGDHHYEDDHSSYDPERDDDPMDDLADEEVYEDDPTQEPGPEWGGDPQPDAEPKATDEGTTVYTDPDYLEPKSDG